MRSARGKDSIVRAALRIFGERGIEATSLREVAKAAGVSPALVVHHFDGKDGLVAVVDETALEAFGAAYSSETAERSDLDEGSDLLRLRGADSSGDA
jgi:AcrR family transcriptional regulator